MNKLLHIVSTGLSILFYPLFMPFYGMLLYFFATHKTSIFLPVYWIIAFTGTFFFTIFIPLCVILVQMRRKQISSIHIDNPKERTTPYIYTLCCYGFWCYFLHSILHISTAFFLSAVGATVALFLVLIINYHWKISAHLCGLGGLIGGMIAYSLSVGIFPSTLVVCLLLCAALLLMYARIYLKAHSDTQVVAGFLLGITITFFPSLFQYV